MMEESAPHPYPANGAKAHIAVRLQHSAVSTFLSCQHSTVFLMSAIHLIFLLLLPWRLHLVMFLLLFPALVLMYCT